MLAHWNVVATAATLQLPHLPALLRPQGAFVHTDFRGVMVGLADDHEALPGTLPARAERRPDALGALARLMPVERSFAFTPEDLLPQLERAVAAYLEEIDSQSFHVRMERRGHKSELHRQPVAQALDRHPRAALEMRGAHARVDFADPALIVVVEAIGDTCGVGCLPRR